MESGLYIPKSGSITPRAAQGNTLKPHADVPDPAITAASGRTPGFSHILIMRLLGRSAEVQLATTLQQTCSKFITQDTFEASLKLVALLDNAITIHTHHDPTLMQAYFKLASSPSSLVQVGSFLQVLGMLL